VGKFVQRLLFHEDDIIYLPIKQSIKPEKDMVLPSEVVRHFVKIANHRWIMDECICRGSENCEHYPIDLGCLFMGEAVKGINPKLGRLASIDEALEHVDQCEAAGLVHLIGRNKLDSVWLNVKPAHQLLTVCNCCECCCLWKILPHVYGPIGGGVHKLDGVNVSVTKHCKGCGICTQTCFVNAISVQNKKAVVSDACRGCGRCVIKCPEKAIDLKIDCTDSIDDAIRRISSMVHIHS
jgi:Pyruvate/2-oxoacid:ferredoxin oxidoreductase delta subunit